MIHALARRMKDEEAGFTLVELMVVVLIISILISIAVPTYKGASDRAADRVAQTQLRQAATAEDAYFADKQDWTADTTVLASLEPALTWVAWCEPYCADASAKQVEVYYAGSPPSDGYLLASKSKSGRTFFLHKSALTNWSSKPGVYYKWTTLSAYPGHLTWWDPVGCACGWTTAGW